MKFNPIPEGCEEVAHSALVDAFCRFYRERGPACWALACMDMGYPAVLAERMGLNFKNDEAVIARLAELEANPEDCTPAGIKAALFKEATRTDAKAMHSAKVSALGILARVTGIDKLPPAGPAKAPSDMSMEELTKAVAAALAKGDDKS
jgi:hypothetical protein